MAEGDVEISVENKKIIAIKIMDLLVTLGSTNNVTVGKPSFNVGTATRVNFTNVLNCVIHVNK